MNFAQFGENPAGVSSSAVLISPDDFANEPENAAAAKDRKKQLLHAQLENVQEQKVPSRQEAGLPSNYHSAVTPSRWR